MFRGPEWFYLNKADRQDPDVPEIGLMATSMPIHRWLYSIFHYVLKIRPMPMVLETTNIFLGRTN